MPEPLLRLRGVRKVYRLDGTEVRALDGVDLDVRRGEFLAVTGASGSGKSTLLQILGLLDRPTEGMYELAGTDVSRLDDEAQAALRARGIGFVFQFFNLLPRATAAENVELPLVYAGRGRREERARAALRTVGLQDRAGHTPAQLSGGQQQRVAIARALVGSPALVLADEPTGNVSTEQAREVMEAILRLNQRGMTVVLSTHEKEIAAYAGREIRMRDGRIIGEERREGRVLPRAARVPGGGRGLAFRGWTRTGENALMALDALGLNRLRTGLAALGIVIGVAALITMMALGAGARAALRERIASMGANLLYVYPQVGPRRIVGTERGEFTRLTLEDATAIEGLRVRGVPVARTAGGVQTRVRVVRGDRNWDTRLDGVPSHYSRMHAVGPAWGRFFTPHEDLSRARLAVLGPTVVEKLFGAQEDPVGQTVRINREYFKVVGVAKAVGGSGWRDRDDQVLVPLQTAMRRVLGVDFLHYIEVEVASPEVSESVGKEIQGLLRRRHNLPPHREDDIRVFDLAEVQETMASTTRIVTTLLGAIAAIALLVGGVGIMNIMLVAVKERTREVGLRKAMGAGSSDILTQFLVESAAITAAGGIIGILLGIGAGWAIARGAGWPVLVSPFSVWVAFGFSALTGVVFGLWPAREAAMLPPAEALRFE